MCVHTLSARYTDGWFLRFRDERARQRTVDVAALKESSSPLRCFTFAFDGESPLGGHAGGAGGGGGGGGDVLQDLLERPFVLVSASGGAVKYKLDLRER